MKVYELSTDPGKALPFLWNELEQLGQPIHVFKRFPFWKPIGVDLQRPAHRSCGTGLNTLHIDCVNAENPPDYVCFYCLRDDPAGGGATVVAEIAGCEDHLSDEAVAELREPVYRDGAVVDLDHVGVDINPFPVLGDRYRYTGRLYHPKRRGVVELDRYLWSKAETIRLTPGMAVIVDQRTTLHGRLELGAEQWTVPEAERRLVLSAYGRAWPTGWDSRRRCVSDWPMG